MVNHHRERAWFMLLPPVHVQSVLTTYHTRGVCLLHLDCLIVTLEATGAQFIDRPLKLVSPANNIFSLQLPESSPVFMIHLALPCPLHFAMRLPHQYLGQGQSNGHLTFSSLRTTPYTRKLIELFHKLERAKGNNTLKRSHGPTYNAGLQSETESRRRVAVFLVYRNVLCLACPIWVPLPVPGHA
jgi:hypothetical protein